MLQRNVLASSLLDTLRVLQVKMYPQLFWGVLALLHTVHVPLYVLVLQVFTALMRSLQLWNLPCQHILQASAPAPRSELAPPSGASICPECYTVSPAARVAGVSLVTRTTKLDQAGCPLL